MSFGPSGNNTTAVFTYFGNGDLNNEHLKMLHERLDNKWSGFEDDGEFDDPVTPFNGSAVYDLKYIVAEYITNYSEVGELYEACNDGFQTYIVDHLFTHWLITKARN